MNILASSFNQINYQLMKKVVLTFGVAAFLAFGLSSCKKTNTCDYGNGDVVEYENLTKTQRDVAKAACEMGGGTWK
jgi:hypothetical protein